MMRGADARLLANRAGSERRAAPGVGRCVWRNAVALAAAAAALLMVSDSAEALSTFEFSDEPTRPAVVPSDAVATAEVHRDPDGPVRLYFYDGRTGAFLGGCEGFISECDAHVSNDWDQNNAPAPRSVVGVLTQLWDGYQVTRSTLIQTARRRFKIELEFRHSRASQTNGSPATP